MAAARADQLTSDECICEVGSALNTLELRAANGTHTLWRGCRRQQENFIARM